MAAEYEDKSRAELGQLGDEIEARMRPVWNALRDSVATAIYEGDGDDQVRLPRQRADLPEQVERLLGDARRNENRPEYFEEVRKYLASWLTDSLVAIVYAIHINDPRGLYFNERQPAWLHRLGPLQDSPEIPDRGGRHGRRRTHSSACTSRTACSAYPVS